MTIMQALIDLFQAVSSIIQNWWRQRRCLSTTRFIGGGKSELFSDGVRITYNTGDVINLDTTGKVIAYKTHDGLEWRSE